MASRVVPAKFFRGGGLRGWLSRPAITRDAGAAGAAAAVGASEPAPRVAAGPAALIPAELGPHSEAMEACRVLRTNLSLGSSGGAPPLLLIGTSYAPARARVAAGLAIALAEEGRRTLLVDADLRQPILHTIFSLPVAPGLADALALDAPEAPETEPWPLFELPVRPALWLLPAGASARSPAELLGLPAAAWLTRGVAERFDAVVYHATGLLAYPDVLLLAAHVRAAVLVIRAGADSTEQVRRVKEALEYAGVDILGFAMVGDQGR